MSFNLLHEPWLPVVRLDGSSAKLGIVEVLKQSKMLRGLVGETATVSSALHRLLLAFLHRTFRPVDDAQWRSLWLDSSGTGFPEEELNAYAQDWASRFDLFDPEAPFFQCPAVPAPRKWRSPAVLVGFRARGNNATLFDHSTDSDKLRLTPDEAARWLVTTQAYDTSGKKTGYDGTGNPSGESPPTARFGCVLVEADTLYRTLMLNLLDYDPADRRPRPTQPDDCPVWERPASESENENGQRLPRGWTDVLTWPSRRIRLSHTTVNGQHMVDGVIVSPGSSCNLPIRDYEHMAAFRAPWFAETASGSSRAAVPMPVRLDIMRGVWRHSQELLLPPERRWWKTYRSTGLKLSETGFPEEEPQRLRPAALEHLAHLADDGALPKDAVYTLRVFGQQVGSGGSGSIAAWCEEVVPAPVALLRARNPRIGLLIGSAVALADDLGSILRALERGFRQEFDEQFTLKEEDKREKAGFRYQSELRYWPRLPTSFAELLRNLALLENIEPGNYLAEAEHEALDKWRRQAVRAADMAAEQWLRQQTRAGRTLLDASAHHERYRANCKNATRVLARAVAARTPPEEA
ncbi:type I-E CRISPR-associated protein Cse1/CasA [Streptomyces noursei]|uniref:type I-E CRISPR-associated protein Cse1/CasA n=1 Tax=Streptomyces noursei TaxID=1971 RepID=UPI0016782533|nr:type I-E CRISPR-associated protein Cse1/CasA [Streptomyces noursei]MCZ1018924.1 type I-E CRISPR-associated protein Cse1/CasA [Streptomyces noursei]